MKRSYVRQVASFFGFYGIVFIPFPSHIIKFQLPVTDFLFGGMIRFVSHTIFGRTLTHTRVSSDSVSMYILLLLLFVLSILTALLIARLKKWALYRDRVPEFIYRLVFYYLAWILLKYGLDKVFKHQFYLPEPNTLYTPLGRVDKELLYWSSMGTSYFYTVFLGWMETLAAIFILIKRTRLIGLLMSFGIMLNVVAVNFGFDISVKLYSLFLLFLTIYLLLPYARRLFQFFLGYKTIDSAPPPGILVSTFLSVWLKWLVVCLIFAEVLYPFIKKRNFNDDLAARPYLHGAYEVKQVLEGMDTMTLMHSPVKRFFIHRRGYMIFQDQKDAMQDYKLSLENSGSLIVLTDYRLHQTRVPFSYNAKDSVLVLHYFINGKEYQLTGKALDWRKLPALRKGFHWTTD